MFERTLFLALLFAFLASPMALAEEIGGGSPESAENSTNQADPVESESDSEDCLTETLLKFFFGDI